jgi:D-alanyl-D-alanine carboxypeptidase (penicillin-binding protein 5/6)
VLVLGAVVFGILFLFRGGGADVADPDEAALALPHVSGTVTPAVASAQATPRRTPRETSPPVISGLAATILDEPCGAVLYAANEDTHYPPASLTKIVTALVAMDEIDDLDEMIEITVDGAALALETDATVMGLLPGQRLSMEDLIYGLLMRSGNDAAIQIAEAVAGSEAAFVAMMNAKVAALGLTDTHFANAHGMDAPRIFTSAHDMALLGHELMKDPFLKQVVNTREYQPGWDLPAIENSNLMLTGYEGSIGIKTGYTDQASETIVAAAEDSGRVLIVTVLKSQDHYRDAGRLLDWGFESTAPAC